MDKKNISNNIFLKDIIRKIQAELIESQKERERSKENPLFSVEKLEIELNFVVNESNDLKGGFNFPIVSVDASKTFSKQQIHKIKLTLNTAKDGKPTFERPPGYFPRA